jgi:hypothetical protein
LGWGPQETAREKWEEQDINTWSAFLAVLDEWKYNKMQKVVKK